MKQDSIARKINRGEIPAVKVGKRSLFAGTPWTRWCKCRLFTQGA